MLAALEVINMCTVHCIYHIPYTKMYDRMHLLTYAIHISLIFSSKSSSLTNHARLFANGRRL